MDGSSLDLGFHVLDSLTNTSPTNVLISPLSLTCSLLMILFGARGPTAIELGKKLFGSDDQNNALNVTTSTILHFRNLLVRINQSNGTSLENHIFVDRMFDLTPDFIMSTRDFFQANIESVDFSGKKENAIAVINRRIREQTKNSQQLDGIINFLSPNTKLLLLNLLSFKKEWKYKFDLRRTKKRPFYTEDGKSIPTDTMYMMNNVDIGASENLNCTVARIPFRGGRLSFAVLLPREGTTLRDLILRLNSKDLRSLFEEQTTRTKTKVLLPKFEIEWSDSLVQPLRETGINRIFDVQSANFSGISNSSTGLFVGDILQKVKVSIDENGARGSAATAAAFKQRSLSFSEDFIANRPFVYLIGSFNRKILTDILFLGTFVHPVDI